MLQSFQVLSHNLPQPVHSDTFEKKSVIFSATCRLSKQVEPLSQVSEILTRVSLLETGARRLPNKLNAATLDNLDTKTEHARPSETMLAAIPNSQRTNDQN